MKVRFPIIGLVTTGSDAVEQSVVNDITPLETVRTPKKSNAKTKFFDLLGGMLDMSARKLSDEKSVSAKILESNKGWVYRNNDAIAQEVSKIEFELYTIGLSNGEIVYNEVESHPLLDLLDNPNAESTKNDFIYTTQSHKKLAGDAFWLKIRKNGQVIGLRSLPPDKIILNLQSPTPEDPTVILSYHYQDSINGEKIDVVYQPEDIIHFKRPNPRNPFRGLGAVEALAETIDLDNLTTDTLLNFYKNGAINNIALSTEAKITDEQLKRLRAELRSTYSGSKNAFKMPIFGQGLKPVDISYSNKQQELLGLLEWYRDKIMYGFGNTKASLGMIDDVNRASHEGSIIEWQRNTIKPDMEAIVNTLNQFLVPEFGDNLVLGFCDPVPEDRADDIQEVKDLYPIGIVTRNEAREMVDLESVDGGDEFFTPSTGVTSPSGGEDQNDENVDQEVEDEDN